MLTIRVEQVATLAAAAEACFRRSLIAEQTAAILAAPEAGVPPLDRTDLSVCIERIVERGVRTPAAIRLYVRMAALLGSGFEARPEHAWLVARLDDQAVSSPDQRVHRAWAVWQHRKAVAAANRASEEAFLRRCSAEAP